MIGRSWKRSVCFLCTMVKLVLLVLLGSAYGGVILPTDSIVQSSLNVGSDPYRNYDRKLEYEPSYYPGKPYGTKYYGQRPYPPTYHLSAVEHDIKQQLAALERNLAAARPYLASNPQILHEAEEQLKTLQHIHANRLLHGIESIRQLELQQEVLIQKVNSQLENSVRQLKRLAVLQQEISDKQKSVPVAKPALPESTLEASRHLTAQLHAIEAAKAHDAAVHGITKEVVDHAIAKEVMDHAIAKEVADHAIAKEVMDQAISKDIANQSRDSMLIPSQSGVSSDEGIFRTDQSGIDPRSTGTEDPLDEEDKTMVFDLGR